jgi:hypothetical protein
VSIPVQSPLHILISQSNANQKLSVTSNLSPILYLWGSALKLDEAKLNDLKLKGDVLLRSSPESWLVPYRAQPLGPRDFEGGRGIYGGPYPLAVWIKGQFPNTFQDMSTIPPWNSEEPTPTGDELVEETPPPAAAAELAPELTGKPGQLLLIGAATIFKANFMAGGGGPLNFFMNAVDAISLGEELTTIRSKREANRLIRRVSPATKIWWRFFTIVLAPLCFACAGILRYVMRQRDKQAYLKTLSLSPS